MSALKSVPSPCRTPADAQRNAQSKLGEIIGKANTFLDAGARVIPVDTGMASMLAAYYRDAGWSVEVSEGNPGQRVLVFACELDDAPYEHGSGE